MIFSFATGNKSSKALSILKDMAFKVPVTDTKKEPPKIVQIAPLREKSHWVLLVLKYSCYFSLGFLLLYGLLLLLQAFPIRLVFGDSAHNDVVPDDQLKECCLLENQPHGQLYVCPSLNRIYFRFKLPTADDIANEISSDKISDSKKSSSVFGSRKLLQTEDAISNAERLGSYISAHAKDIREMLRELMRRRDSHGNQEGNLKPKEMQNFKTSSNGETAVSYKMQNLKNAEGIDRIGEDPKPEMAFPSLIETIFSGAMHSSHFKSSVGKESDDHKNIHAAFEEHGVSPYIESFGMDTSNETIVRFPPAEHVDVEEYVENVTDENGSDMSEGMDEY